MGMQLPEWARETFLVVTGDGWPEADEDALWALAGEWAGVGNVVDGLHVRMREPVRGVRRTDWDGPAAQAFALAGQGSAGLVRQQVQGLAAGSLQVSDFIYETGVNVQYMKIIVLEELVLLAAQIAHLIAMAVPTCGASMAAVPGLKALGQLFARLAQWRLCAWLMSAAAGEVLQLALDSMAQAVQLAMKTRTHWDEALTENAAITGAVGAALGPVVHRAVAGLVGRGALGQVVGSAVHEFGTSAVTGAVTRQGFVGSPWDVTAGATEGAVDAAQRAVAQRRRHGVIPPLLDVAVPTDVLTGLSAEAPVEGADPGVSPTGGGAGSQQPVSRVSTDQAETAPVSEIPQPSPEAAPQAAWRQQGGQQGEPPTPSQQGSPETVPAEATPQQAGPHAAPVEAGRQAVLPQVAAGAPPQAERATAASSRPLGVPDAPRGGEGSEVSRSAPQRRGASRAGAMERVAQEAVRRYRSGDPQADSPAEAARQWRQQSEQQAVLESSVLDAWSGDRPQKVHLRRVGLPGGAPGERWRALDEEALVRRLAARGLVLEDVLPDGDSFWNSLVVVAEDRIRARLGLAEGEPVTAMAVRRFVADHVAADGVASSSVGDPDADPVPLIMAPGVRPHQGFARVAEAAAQALGLPVTVTTSDLEYHIGGGDGPRLHLARFGDTYRPVLSEPASAQADGTDSPRSESTRSVGVSLPPLSWSSSGSWLSSAESLDSWSSESLDSGSEDGEWGDIPGEASWLAAGAEVAADPAALVRHIVTSPDLRAQWSALASLGELNDSLEQPLSDPELVAQLGRLVTELGRQPQLCTENLRSAMNVALLMSAVEPAPDVPGGSSQRYYPRVMPGLSIRRLTEVVAAVADDLAVGVDPLSRSDGPSPLSRLGYEADQPVAEQVARLSLVNLASDLSDSLAEDPLFTSLIESDLVEVALRATDGVEQAVYLQTGYAAAVNQSVRAQVPTIVGLLAIGRCLHAATDNQRRRLRPEVLRRTVRHSLFGFRRTVGRLVEQYLNEASVDFDEIESQIQGLLYRREAIPPASTEDALRGLMPQWSRAMQTLSALSSLVSANGSGRVPVLSPAWLPGSTELNWGLRAARAAIAGTAADFDQERRSLPVLGENYGRLLERVLAAPLARTAAGQTERDGGLASAPLDRQAADGEAFWRVVWRQPGHSVRVTGDSPYAPTYVVRATTTGTRRLFLVEDPLRGAATAVSPSQLRQSLNDRDMRAVLLPARELRPLVDQNPAAEASFEPVAVHLTESARHRGLSPEDFEGTAHERRIISGLRRGEVLLEQFDPNVRSELARIVLGQQSKDEVTSESPPELSSDGSDSDGSDSDEVGSPDGADARLERTVSRD